MPEVVWPKTRWGVNVTGDVWDNSYFNEFMRTAPLFVIQNGVWKEVASPTVAVDGSVSYVDASDVGMGIARVPTKFPDGAGYTPNDRIFYPMQLPFGVAPPAHLQGVYDVAFTPGLAWDVPFCHGVVTVTDNNRAAGTATLTIADVPRVSVTLIELLGYDNGSGTVARTLPPEHLWRFSIRKRGAVGKFRPEAIASLRKLTGNPDRTGYSGWLRFMTPLATNKRSVGGITHLPQAMRPNAATVGKFEFDPIYSAQDMVDLGIAVGAHIKWNIDILATDQAVIDAATYFRDAMPAGMIIGTELANECWHFSAGFMQTTWLYERAQAAGRGLAEQYATEYRHKLDLIKQVFGASFATRVRPFVAWQVPTATPELIRAILDTGDLWRDVKSFLLAPYILGGIGGDQWYIGNYNQQAIFTQAERDIVVSDPAAFKARAFAIARANSDVVRDIYHGFAANLAAYVASKGLPVGAIESGCYEYNWQHITESNTPQPQKEQTWQAFADMLRDPRAGELQAYQDAWIHQVGGDVMLFLHAHSIDPGYPVTYGQWSIQDRAGLDSQEPFASHVAYVAAHAE